MEEYKTRRLASSIDIADLTKADYSYEDFIYSVTLKKELADGKVFNLVFGANGGESGYDTFWSLSLDFEHQSLRLGNEELDAIKSVDYVLSDDVILIRRSNDEKMCVRAIL